MVDFPNICQKLIEYMSDMPEYMSDERTQYNQIEYQNICQVRCENIRMSDKASGCVGMSVGGGH